MKEPFVHEGAVKAYLQAFAKRGFTDVALMSHLELDKHQLSGSRIPLSKLLLIQSKIQEYSQDPNINLAVGAGFSVGTYGKFQYLTLTRKNLKRMLEDFVNYSSFLSSYANYVLLEQGPCTFFIKRLMVDAKVISEDLTSFCFSGIIAGFRHLLGNSWSPLEVHLTRTQPKIFTGYQTFYRCPIIFDGPVDQIVFKTADLQTENFACDEKLAKLLEKSLHEDMSPGSKNIATQVSDEISKRIGLKPISISVIADQLGKSTRTLQRELFEEGETYFNITEKIRKELAIRYLVTHSLSVKETANLLGFSDPATFRRAFFRWYGHLPTKIRL